MGEYEYSSIVALTIMGLCAAFLIICKIPDFICVLSNKELSKRSKIIVWSIGVGIYILQFIVTMFWLLPTNADTEHPILFTIFMVINFPNLFVLYFIFRWYYALFIIWIIAWLWGWAQEVCENE